MARHVLVLDGTSRSIVAISRSLARRGIPVLCAQIDRRGLGLHSNTLVADVALNGNAASFLRELRSLLTLYDVDTIFPCSDKAMKLLLPHYEELAQSVRLSMPAPNIAIGVLDKEATLTAARHCAIPVPRTISLGLDGGIEHVKNALHFPLVAKPSIAGVTNPFKLKYFATAAELEAFANTPQCTGPIVFQEYFEGEGVGLSTIVCDGAPLLFFSHRRLHEYPPDGGVGVLVESQPIDGELARAAAALLRTLRWQGPAMVEFRYNRSSREYVLMEVNGRFWGSLPLAIAAGVDFPYLQWQIAHSVTPAVPASYRQHLRMRWTSGELQRCADLLTDRALRRRLRQRWYAPLLETLQSFAPGTRSALGSWNDPQPAIRDALSTSVRTIAAILWRAGQRALPSALAGRLRQLRTLDPLDRKTYVWRWLARTMSPRRHNRAARRWSRARHVTLVCRANRIRSPLAAAILASEVGNNGLHIESAGTRAAQDTRFDPRAEAAAYAMGLTLSGSPQTLNEELVRASELIVVMDRIVEAELLTQFPSAAGNTFLLNEIAGIDGSDEIEDPDKAAEPEFYRFISALSASVRRMARRLS